MKRFCFEYKKKIITLEFKLLRTVTYDKKHPLKDFLNKPYPYTDRNKILKVNLIISVFVFLFLYLFSPFGLNNIPSLLRLKFCLIFALITFLVSMFFGFVLPKMFPGYYNEDRWIVKREIINITLLISSIAISNFLYIYYIGGSPFNLNAFLWMLVSTLSVGGIVVLGLVAVQTNRSLKRNLQAAQNMSSKIDTSESSSPPESKTASYIHLPSEIEKQSLDIPITALIYLTSEANYIECHYLDEQSKPRSSKIRNRMKVIESIIAEQASFFRCHRAFIVNMDYVKSIEGNAKGYTLILKSSDILIPVSRAKSSELKQRLS